jgi:hypothetical protein
MKRHDTQSCKEILERIPLYVGGDLDPEALEAVRTHVDACESCARCAGDASRARQVFLTSFREREAVLPRPDLWAGIRGVLVDEGRIPGSLSRDAAVTRTPRSRLRLVRHVTSLAAAAALLVYAGLNFFQAPTVLDVVDTPGPGAHGRDVAVIVRPDVSASGLASGQLRRVGLDELGLLDSAGPLRFAESGHPMTRMDAPGVPLGAAGGTQLASSE